jgi:hypothetical protein
VQSTQCLECRHYQGSWTCEAYQEEGAIPDEIGTGLHDHRKPFPGDHGVRWERLPSRFVWERGDVKILTPPDSQKPKG